MNTNTAIASYIARGGNEQTARQIIGDAIARGYGLADDLWYYGFTTPAKAQRMADAIEADAESHRWGRHRGGCPDWCPIGGNAK